MRRALVSLLTLLALVTLAAPAQAQGTGCDPTQAELDRAIGLFRQGTDHVQNFRWSDAVPMFEEAYALTCRSAALYNLGMAQRALGHHRAARDTFRRLVANHPDIEAELREEVTQIQREEAARVAVLELTGIASDVRPEITFDGLAVEDDGARPISVETDAGRHSLVAQIPEHEPFLWDGELGDGQRRALEILFTPLPVAVQGESFDPTWLIVTLAVAAVVGAGIGIGVFLWEDSLIQPNHPNRVMTIGPGS